MGVKGRSPGKVTERYRWRGSRVCHDVAAPDPEDIMPRLIFSATCSLDGFMAGPGGDMSWLTEHLEEPNPHAQRLLAGTGALLVGRRTYDGDDPNRGTDNEGAFGGQYDGPVVVLTHQPPDDSMPGVTFVSDLHAAAAAAKDAAGASTYVNVLGADVGRQCLDGGLLDEVLVFFVPVLLGAGTRMFASRNGDRIDLEPVTDDAVHWYRVRR
jgi:dihydrofolate reductase